MNGRLSLAVRVWMRYAKEFATPEALQEYLKQHPKADKSKHTVKQRGEKSKSPEDSASGSQGSKNPDQETKKGPSVGQPKPRQHPFAASLNITHEDIAEAAKKHADEFNSILEGVPELLKSGGWKHEVDATEVPHWDSISDPEKVLFLTNRKVGKQFLKNLTPEESNVHKKLHSDWIESSGNPDSQKLHGALESLGVHGTRAPEEVDSEEVTQQREQGKDDKEFLDYLKKSYTYQQAFFQHIGLKSMTLFRGVSGDEYLDNAETGTPAQVQTREASSFSGSPNISASFGQVIQFKVPAENILFSPCINPQYVHEQESVVMGGSGLIGSVYGRRKESSANKPPKDSKKPKKPIVVPISKKNEDWLSEVRKNRQHGRTLKAVLARFLA